MYSNSGSGYTAGNTSTSSGSWKCFKVWLVIEMEGNERLVEVIMIHKLLNINSNRKSQVNWLPRLTLFPILDNSDMNRI